MSCRWRQRPDLEASSSWVPVADDDPDRGSLAESLTAQAAEWYEGALPGFALYRSAGGNHIYAVIGASGEPREVAEFKCSPGIGSYAILGVLGAAAGYLLLRPRIPCPWAVILGAAVPVGAVAFLGPVVQDRLKA